METKITEAKLIILMTMIQMVNHLNTKQKYLEKHQHDQEIKEI